MAEKDAAPEGNPNVQYPDDFHSLKTEGSQTTEMGTTMGCHRRTGAASNESDSGDDTQPNTKSQETDVKKSEPKKISYDSNDQDLLEGLLNGPNQKLIDRLLGCAYGQALGDAYGLATEFEDRVSVEQNYPNGSEIIPFPDYVPTGHNRRWTRGDWTDDTDQWILILDTLVDHYGDVKVFAKKLSQWIRYGFEELGDWAGLGLGANVSQVVRSPGFLDDPLKASEEVWERGNRKAAPNGAVMRCSSCAFVLYNDLDKLESCTIDLCKTTHFDPRCIASCLAVCLTVAYLLREEFDDNNIEQLIKRVQNETIEILGDQFTKEHKAAFLWHTSPRTLEELNLDELGKIGYTYKCLASGFYGLRSNESFAQTLNALIRYGGDADTNGAVCGTMYGARRGYKSLPQEWLREMPYKRWLDQKIIRTLKYIKVIDEVAPTSS